MRNNSKRAFVSELQSYQNDVFEREYQDQNGEENSGLSQIRLLVGASMGALLGLLLAFVLTSDIVILPQLLASLGDNAIALVVAMFGIVFGILLSSNQPKI